MARQAPRTPVLLFGFLTLYILLQSAWWMWLVVRKDHDIFELQQQLLREGITPDLVMRLPKHTLWMVLGEGLVFLVLVLLALWLSFRTMRHELSLARQQRDFLMAASHELRTPISALKLHLQTLMRPDLDPARRDMLAQTARGDIDRLHALAEQVLLASRLEEHGVTLHPETVDVAALAGEIIGEARASYGRHHQITGTLPDGLLLWTDPTSFRTIMGNLLENACKYSAKDTVVEVELGRSHAVVHLKVADHGIGILERDRQRIFSKFYRGGNEATRVTKGTGLGLFIVRRLLEDLGGRVEFRSTQPHGSTFTAFFPDRS